MYTVRNNTIDVGKIDGYAVYLVYTACVYMWGGDVAYTHSCV